MFPMSSMGIVVPAASFATTSDILSPSERDPKRLRVLRFTNVLKEVPWFEAPMKIIPLASVIALTSRAVGVSSEV